MSHPGPGGLRHPPGSQVVIPKARISTCRCMQDILHKISNAIQGTDNCKCTSSVMEGFVYMFFPWPYTLARLCIALEIRQTPSPLDLAWKKFNERSELESPVSNNGLKQNVTVNWHVTCIASGLVPFSCFYLSVHVSFVNYLTCHVS